MSVLLNESLADTVMVYLIIKKLSTPFEKWPAYEEGIIDGNGKKIKEPITFKQRKAWTFFDRFIANLKRIMSKFVGKSRFAAIATAAILLKDSLAPSAQLLLSEDRAEISGMTVAMQKALHVICEELRDVPQLNLGTTDMNMELHLERYLPIVEAVIGEQLDELKS